MSTDGTAEAPRTLSAMNRVMAHTVLTSGDLLCFGKEGAEHSELCDLFAYTLQAKDEALRIQGEELDEWRGAVAAAFGVETAAPRATLCGIAKAQREHHLEHHQRERRAWESLRQIAVAYNAAATEKAAEAALGLLDEQGDPS